MQDLLEFLNEGQRQAVLSTDGPLLVLSGAGTGKTRVIINRIAYIMYKGFAEPEQILAMTFANKAAGEIKKRLGEFPIKEGDGYKIWAGTFHSIGLRLLRENSAYTGLRTPFVILNDDDQKLVVKNVIKNMGLDKENYDPAVIMEKIGSMKDKMNTSLGSADLDKILYAYQAELERMNAVDFGDLIIKPIKMLIDNPDILKKYQSQFKYVMVDEYQDINASQYQLMRLLASGSGNICCVGDDDQSIYSWRGSEVKNILGFQKEYKDAKVIRLEKNYRSTPEILGAANSLIKNNEERLGKNLEATKDSGDKVQVVRVWNDIAEAEGIANAIQDMARDGENYSDIAILVRRASLLKKFEDEFIARKIPYRLIGDTKFYDHTEIRDAIAYARLLVYPFDDVSFARIFNKPKRGMGDVALGHVREFARANHISCMDALNTMSLPPRMAKGAADFAKIFSETTAQMDDLTPDEALQKILDGSGYIQMWKDSVELDKDERMKRIAELIHGIKGYPSLEAFLEEVALAISDDEDEAKSGNVVSMMTIHKAKGLEFKNVFLPAWEEGIFPDRRPETDLEEERRLAYVAITRAIKRLVISFTNQRYMFVEDGPPRPVPQLQSIFIDEIDGEFVERVGFYKGNKQWAPAFAGVTKQDSEVAKRAAAMNTKSNMQGKLVSHEELGKGVLIELDGEIATVAFRDAGIKKVDVRFLRFE
ncbi:MAG: UvrD-helicase domain-containing protein [Rickettsiales bacterium]|nr:UvrD-helicase domain-containing protein [Rickettsiales bacterium]